MNRLRSSELLLCLFSAFCFARADQWTAPTPEELAMTALPQVPGASALFLYKEQTTDDSLHAHSIYVRLKVLTEAGKDYANVQLPFVSGSNGYEIDSIAGRTIHPDGTIIPFSGKPYEKLIVKTGGYKEKQKVFTLPSVEIGSIVEYRYKIRFDDNSFWSPDWFIQGDLFVRKAHYMWRPTDKTLLNEKGDIVSGRIAWAPILPADVKVQQGEAPITRGLELKLDVHDIMPTTHEDFMPPMDTLSYRVLFYYTAFKTSQEFWAHAGKEWAKDRDRFIGNSSKVKEYVSTLVAATDTQQQKADKLYAAVMMMENTDFTREHSSREDHSEGLKEVKSTEDVLARKRGEGDQLAELFVAMARAAGLKAYVAGVADRNSHFFLPIYLSVRQIDDLIAIVNIDGKDVYYDPGERYCEPGHVMWRHSLAGGIRETDAGTELLTTPPESYKFSQVKRIADLALDEHGVASGTVSVTYRGDPALNWRQKALRGDEASLKDELRTTLEGELPGGVEIEVSELLNVQDYEKPFVVRYTVKGAVGTVTGKRLMIPADLFEANSKPRFSSPTRVELVDMHFASLTQDAVRWKLPETLVVESAPESDKAMMQQVAAFESFSKKTSNSITTFRNITIGSPFFKPADYPDLRSFYTKIETKDQETVVLSRVVPGAPAATPIATPAAANKPTGE